MSLSLEDLEYEVLRIFERLRIPMGGKLGHAMLIKEWSQTQLRYDDLTCAVRRLINRQVLKEEHASDDEMLQLTQRGFARVMELRRHQFRNWLKLMRLNLVLALSRSSMGLRGHHRFIR